MASPHIINKSSLAKALKKPYPDMVQAYYYYGLGEPSEQMVRFYKNNRQRILKSDAKGDHRLRKIRECEHLITLLEAILRHELHNAPKDTFGGTISGVERLKSSDSLMEGQVSIHQDKSY